ncbi:hypothetical protein GGX14DRAFT_383807 [Mycena pura]|uniref:Uncharacterized protein n=1 Tax=Mycena pura TaxID=153505 RepID=A0AAD7E5D1_9AGAR|nr:hypothetical protein GGX14DRAFT_383807 [Mycena pura]
MSRRYYIAAQITPGQISDAPAPAPASATCTYAAPGRSVRIRAAAPPTRRSTAVRATRSLIENPDGHQTAQSGYVAPQGSTVSSARKAPHAPAAAHAASPLLRTYYPHIRARATAHLCLWRNACEGAGAWRNRLLPGGNTDLPGSARYLSALSTPGHRGNAAFHLESTSDYTRVRFLKEYLNNTLSTGPFRGFETVDGRGFGRHGTTEHDGSMHIIYIYWLAEINRGPPICQKGSAYPQTDADKPLPTPATAVPSPVPFRRDFRNLAGVLNFAHRPPIKTAVPVDSYAGISAVEVPRFVLGSALYI